MANVSQGTTVTWGGAALGEVISVSVDGITAESVDVTPRSNASRFKSYSPADNDFGSVSLTVRGAALMSSTNVGLTAALSIGGTGVAWTFNKAMLEKLGWAATVGELQQYNITFKAGA
jgi:hypothetical protein